MNQNNVDRNDYKAKAAYQNPSEANNYDQRRFTNLKGRLTDALEKRAIKKALAYVEDGSRVLDAPCGTGRITRLLLSLGYRTTGADISEEMLSIARQTLGEWENLEALEIGDAERLPYTDGEFGAVTAIRFMNHVPADLRVQVLKEMARVSETAIITSYCNPKTVSALKRKIKMKICPAAPWHPATSSDVRREADAAGLNVVAVYPILGFISETNIYVLKKKRPDVQDRRI